MWLLGRMLSGLLDELIDELVIVVHMSSSVPDVWGVVVVSVIAYLIVCFVPAMNEVRCDDGIG